MKDIVREAVDMGSDKINIEKCLEIQYRISELFNENNCLFVEKVIILALANDLLSFEKIMSLRK